MGQKNILITANFINSNQFQCFHAVAFNSMNIKTVNVDTPNIYIDNLTAKLYNNKERIKYNSTVTRLL